MKWRTRTDESEAAAPQGAAAPAAEDLVTERLNRQHRRLVAVENDLMRIGTQVAALEQRVEALAQRLDLPDVPATSPERAEARSLVEQVRREHAQVRARISAAVRFEERLRQVEDALAARQEEEGR